MRKVNNTSTQVLYITSHSFMNGFKVMTTFSDGTTTTTFRQSMKKRENVFTLFKSDKHCEETTLSRRDVGQWLIDYGIPSGTALSVYELANVAHCSVSVAKCYAIVACYYKLAKRENGSRFVFA